MRRWIKWIGIICLIPIVLVLLIAILLYIPPVQNFVLQKATRYASEATGMDINVDRILLTFPLNLTLDGIEVITEPGDTLVTLQQLSVRVSPLPLLNSVVSISELTLDNARINTGSFLDGMEVQGVVNHLSAQADEINLTDQKATLNKLDLSQSAITLRIDSIAESDTTASDPLLWVMALEQINIEQLCFAMQMPADSLRLSTYIDRAALADGLIDLGLSRYTIDQFSISQSTLNYDGDDNLPAQGLDPMHIALSELNISVNNIVYQDREINAGIEQFTAQERSGLAVTSLQGEVRSDSLMIEIPELILNTTDSEVRLLASIPWSVLDEVSEGNMHAMLTASIGKQDVFIFANTLPADFRNAYPNRPINLSAGVEGNLNALTLQQLKAELPTAFSLTAAGRMGALTDSVNRFANIKLQAQTQQLDFAKAFLTAEQRNQFNIPSGIRLSGDVILQDQEFQTRLLVTEHQARIQLAARYHTIQESYKASLAIDSLEPIRYMPNDSLLWVTASVEAEGQGTDIYAASTWATLEGQLSDIQYGTMAIEDVTFAGSLRQNQASFELNSQYPTAQMDISLNATLLQNDISGMLIMNVDSLDLYALHLMSSPFNTSFNLFGEVATDLQKEYNVDLSIGNWDIVMGDIMFSPQILTLQARTDEDTTRVSLNSGDLGLRLTGNADVMTMADKFTVIANEVNNQLVQDSTINIAALRPVLPDMSLQISAERDNPLFNFLRRSLIVYNSFFLDASTSPEDGLLLDAGLYGLRQDTLQFDTIQATIRPDSAGLIFTAGVIKNQYRQQLPFTASVQGSLRYRYADAEVLYTNHENEIGLSFGVRALQESDGFLIQLFPDDVILAFNQFSVSPDNYIRYRSMQNIEADLRLTGLQNASLWIHSMPSSDGYPEIHAELSQIDLDVITTGFGDLPHMQGILSADLQYAPQQDSSFLVVADMNIDNLIYENGRVGEIMLNGVYLPLQNSEHQIDVHIYRDRQEIASANALYNATQTENNIAGNLNLTTLPFDMLNPFIPDSMARMTGALNGTMAIAGSASEPVLNGYLQMDSTTAYIGMIDTRLRFDDKRIEVNNSLISFNRYNIYSTGDNPFVIDGNVDISNLSQMMADLRLTANNMRILDAERTRESIAYGTVLINFDSTVRGPLNALVVRGNLGLLGGTDVTYVMTDSPLTVQDRLEGLVTFTSFTDTVMRRRQQEQLPLGGMDMLLVINIDPAVQLRVDLSPDRSNYAQIEGGGNLSFQYTPQGDMVLNGRYTFSEGLVNYSLPVVPLNEFNIKPDSYVQWDGELLNPLLSVTATERMRVAAQTADQGNRMINFEVGISVENYLDNMDLEFMIAAPEDQNMQSELNNLAPDERSRRAVAMMVTGIYLGTGGSGDMNFNMGDALNNFLNNEISNIAGSALKTIDISFGMDVYNNESGNEQRDFSFQFAKRFYNDRIRVVVGGRVSTTENMGRSESALDNASVEYRLDQAGTKYVKAFYDRNYESLVEGEIIETGVGIVFRKKMRKLRELFDFRKKRVEPVPEEPEENEETEQVENGQQISEDE